MKSSSNNIYKLFTVYINTKPYNVYNIEYKEHYGYNDTPKTWWLYYNEVPILDLLPNPDDKAFVPFNCKSVIRRLWKFEIEQHNTTKHKHDNIDFRNSVMVKMFCNDKLVYKFFTIGTAIDFALAKIQYLQVILSEHPYNFFEPETEEGRKIYWYGLPATIKTGYDVGEIIIVPDYTTGLSPIKWFGEYQRRAKPYQQKNEKSDLEEIDDEEYFDEQRAQEINWGSALSDQHINWFRN